MFESITRVQFAEFVHIHCEMDREDEEGSLSSHSEASTVDTVEAGLSDPLPTESRKVTQVDIKPRVVSAKEFNTNLTNSFRLESDVVCLNATRQLNAKCLDPNNICHVVATYRAKAIHEKVETRGILYENYWAATYFRENVFYWIDRDVTGA